MNKKGAGKEGFATVEAVFAVVVFLGVVIVFFSFYKLIIIQQKLDIAAYMAAHEAGVYGMITDKETNQIISHLYFSERVKSLLDSKDFEGFIRGSIDGISFWGSDILDENENVVINISYEFIFPFPGSIFKGIDINQSLYLKSFTGRNVLKKVSDEIENEDENSERKAYVCEGSEIYHIYADCTYIKMSLTVVQGKRIDKLRNESGGKYKPCEVCNPVLIDDNNYYIARYGDKYHQSSSCSTLKRNVKTISIDEAKTKKLCSKCAKRQEKE